MSGVGDDELPDNMGKVHTQVGKVLINKTFL